MERPPGARFGQADDRAVGFVERRDNLSYEEFLDQYCEPNRQVIHTDAAEEWPATEKWTPSYLAPSVGHRRVVIDGATYSVAHLVDLVADSIPEAPAPFLRAQKATHVLPELPAISNPRSSTAVRTGWRAAYCPRHYGVVVPTRSRWGPVERDSTSSIATRITCPRSSASSTETSSSSSSPPIDAPICIRRNRRPNQSRIDIFDRDSDRHPEFRRAKGIEITLHPGEAVFVPAGWWHTIRMPDPSISVTWNMVNSTNWGYVVADTRTRIQNRSTSASAGLFALYAAGFARTRSTREDRKVDAGAVRV